MDRSAFRVWFEDVLRPLTGRRVQWPQLLRAMIRDEINLIKEKGVPYTGPRLLIDRDAVARGYANRPDQHREDLSVYRLYLEVLEQAAGCLTVGGDPIWLLSCKVPNQGNHSVRLAD